MRAAAAAGAGVRRWLLVAAALSSLLAVAAMAPSGAGFVARTGTQGGWAAAIALAAPTNVTVTQACQAAPAPVLRSSTSAGGGNTTTLTLVTPSGVVAGDLLLAGISWYNAGSDIPAPSGWTKVRVTPGDPFTQAVFYRVAVASEPASHTFTHNAGAKFGGILAYSGVDPASLLLASGSSGQFLGNSGGSITAPALTTRRPGTKIIGFFGIKGQTTITGDSRMTTRFTGSSTNTTSADANITVLAASETRPTTGDTGTRTATGTGVQAIGQLVALEPPLRPHATVSWTRSTSTNATGQLYRRYAGTTLQLERALAVDLTSTVDGPLVSGTAYRAAVLATAGTSQSAEASATFTAMSC